MAHMLCPSLGSKRGLVVLTSWVVSSKPKYFAADRGGASIQLQVAIGAESYGTEARAQRSIVGWKPGFNSSTYFNTTNCHDPSMTYQQQDAGLTELAHLSCQPRNLSSLSRLELWSKSCI